MFLLTAVRRLGGFSTRDGKESGLLGPTERLGRLQVFSGYQGVRFSLCRSRLVLTGAGKTRGQPLSQGQTSVTRPLTNALDGLDGLVNTLKT